MDWKKIKKKIPQRAIDDVKNQPIDENIDVLIEIIVNLTKLEKMTE